VSESRHRNPISRCVGVRPNTAAKANALDYEGFLARRRIAAAREAAEARNGPPKRFPLKIEHLLK